ncbi:MAG: glycosyltransferase family 4 protein [Thermoplasmata archaeon]
MLRCLGRKVDELAVVTNDAGGFKNINDMPSIIELPRNRTKFLFSTVTNKNIMGSDIIHDTFGYFLPLGMLSKLRMHCKYVTSVYGSSAGWLEKAAEIDYQNREEIKQKKYMASRESINAKISDFIFVNCSNFKEDYVNHYGIDPDNIEIIPNSVIVDENIPPPTERDAKAPFRILHVGNISKIKGSLLLLEAFNKLTNEKYAAELTIIGKPVPHDLKYLKNMKNSKVKLLGHVPEERIKEHYIHADVLVHPSYQEGMPRVIMEALSCGLPVIASDLPGIKSIDSTGKFIRVMKNFEEDTLTQLIIDDIARPRKSERFFHESREHMGGFSPESTAGRIHGRYMKL